MPPFTGLNLQGQFLIFYQTITIQGFHLVSISGQQLRFQDVWSPYVAACTQSPLRRALQSIAAVADSVKSQNEMHTNLEICTY